MKRIPAFFLVILLLAGCGQTSEQPQRGRATAVVHGSEYHGEELIDQCEPGGWTGSPPVGEIKFRVVKEDGVVKGKAIAYRISGIYTGGEKANVNLGLRVWDNTAGSGSGSLPGNANSADSMKQDGQWHALTIEVGKRMNFDVKRARFSTQFIFDVAGSDPDCWAMNHEFVF